MAPEQRREHLPLFWQTIMVIREWCAWFWVPGFLIWNSRHLQVPHYSPSSFWDPGQNVCHALTDCFKCPFISKRFSLAQARQGTSRAETALDQSLLLWNYCAFELLFCVSALHIPFQLNELQSPLANFWALREECVRTVLLRSWHVLTFTISN